MHPIDQGGLKQITEELLACGVHLDEPLEPIEVGILEPTGDLKPREPRARRPSQWSNCLELRIFRLHGTTEKITS